ncbi:TetR family transcriptional regulator [Aerococcus urinaeequi]|uniref:TetR/AcrR family transcriptional regulator n=1 Tax=Aerococcus urinaeequi TaxID=51665 RepID=UPI000744CDC2|nr:TetR/AcrR family transcriptional regulator [Aerococcus urinaeequi]ALZ88387.1 TetR family transcriptional regulator [Aerococcus urinaeequi]
MNRKTETKEKIKAAFIDLVHEKGFEAMTVSDIARRCDINRGTFYLHYVDKYDLMNKLEEEVMYDLEAIILKDSDQDQDQEGEATQLIPYDEILEALVYVKAEFAFVKAIASPGGDPNFMQTLKSIIGQLIDMKVKQSNRLKFEKIDLPEDYAIEILLSSIVGIITLWIKKDGKESPEEIAHMITKAKLLSPYELLL